MQRYDDYVCLIRQPVEALLGAEATMNITQISGIIYDGARPLDFNITSRRRVCSHQSVVLLLSIDIRTPLDKTLNKKLTYDLV